MEIVNRVAESAIETVDLASLVPDVDVVEFDLAPFLYRGVVLREKEFRGAVKAHDWSVYAGKAVAVLCSADALVPTWAYMLVAARLDGVAAHVGAGRADDLRRDVAGQALDAYDWRRHAGKPVVLKGCGTDRVPLDAFVRATRRLQAVASKVMYGEPCSSVPVWRRPSAAPASGPAGASSPAPAVRPTGVRPAGPPRR